MSKHEVLMNAPQIGKEFGLTAMTVKKVLAKAKVPPATQYKFGTGQMHLYRDVEARQAMQAYIATRRKSPTRRPEEAVSAPAQGDYGTQLAALEDAVAALSDQVRALQDLVVQQNRALLTQIGHAVDNTATLTKALGGEPAEVTP